MPLTRKIQAAALELVKHRPPNAETVQLFIAISDVAWMNQDHQDWESAEHYAQRAVEMAQELGLLIELSDVLGALSTAYGALGLCRERVDIELRRLELSRDPGFSDIRSRINVLYQTGEALVYVGDYSIAMPHLLEAETLAAQIQDVDLQFAILRVQSHCLYKMDQWVPVIKLEEKWRALENRYPGFFKVLYGGCFELAINASVHARRGALQHAQELQAEFACHNAGSRRQRAALWSSRLLLTQPAAHGRGRVRPRSKIPRNCASTYGLLGRRT